MILEVTKFDVVSFHLMWFRHVTVSHVCVTRVHVSDCTRTAEDTSSCERECGLYPVEFLHVVYQWQLSSSYTYAIIGCPLIQ